MIIDYNMSKEYCSDWTAIDAIREIAQNAIDSGKPVEYYADEYEIEVVTNGARLNPQVFSMGISEKSDGAIGKYGEGFKIAMLVLTRLGLNPIIQTGKYLIKGLFKIHEFTGVETFCLDIEELGLLEDMVDFICSAEGIDLEELRTKITYFNDEHLPMPDSVDILPDKPGFIFVNGLYVTHDPLLFYGYNFAPHKIKLNRDRNMADGLHWQLAEFYSNFSPDKARALFELIEMDAPDVSNVDCWTHGFNKELKAKLVELFYEKYGNDARVARPGTNYQSSGNMISCSSVGARIYSACGISEANREIDKTSPENVLALYKAHYKKRLRRDMREDLDKIITLSKGWRKSDIL